MGLLRTPSEQHRPLDGVEHVSPHPPGRTATCGPRRRAAPGIAAVSVGGARVSALASPVCFRRQALSAWTPARTDPELRRSRRHALHGRCSRAPVPAKVARPRARRPARSRRRTGRRPPPRDQHRPHPWAGDSPPARRPAARWPCAAAASGTRRRGRAVILGAAERGIQGIDHHQASRVRRPVEPLRQYTSPPLELIGRILEGREHDGRAITRHS